MEQIKRKEEQRKTPPTNSCLSLTFAMKYFSKCIHFSIWSFYRACTGLLAVDAIKKPVGAHSVKYNIRTVAIISAPTLQVLAEMRAKVRPFDVLCPDRYPLLYMMIRLFRLLLPG